VLVASLVVSLTALVSAPRSVLLVVPPGRRTRRPPSVVTVKLLAALIEFLEFVNFVANLLKRWLETFVRWLVYAILYIGRLSKHKSYAVRRLLVDDISVL